MTSNDGFDVNNMDTSVSPAVDFNRYGERLSLFWGMRRNPQKGGKYLSSPKQTNKIYLQPTANGSTVTLYQQTISGGGFGSSLGSGIILCCGR